MIRQRCASCVLIALLTFVVSPTRDAVAQRNDDKKPSLSLKANPPVGFSPLKVRLVVEIKGGADDAVDFYCPSIEWDWGDDTKSTNAADCDPYEAGKSQIKRRFTADHTYRQAGDFRIQFRMKKKDKTTGASVSVKVRPGIYDGGHP
jgi:hypothetical protein